MRRPRRAMAEINVVPYIDVMLVLLIIFMVCAPLITPGQIDLPSVGQALNPTVAPLEIRLGKDGAITLVDRQQGGREQRVSKSELLAAVKQIQSKHLDQAVVISADKDIRYEAVVAVLDTLQKGQIKRVGLLAKPAS
ncbi:biopolymer transporter ExbD [Betaproteobacteria bacterium UKL13-2]|nr:biopolymer transporter ExbD [Betaproteobacteria bacterium UKL13-2]HCG52678.1 protein TolR [Betaproteobacteria bacterium]